MKLSQKLSLAMGTLTLLVAIGVLFGIVEMRRIGGSIGTLTESSIPGIVEVLQIDTLTSDYTLNLIRHVYAVENDEMKLREQRLSTIAKNIAAAQQRYEKLITDDNNRTLWDAYLRTSREVLKIGDDALKVSRALETKDALKILDGAYTETYYIMTENIKKLVAADLKGTKALGADINATIDNSNTTLTGLLVVAILMAIGVSVFLIRSVLQQLGKDPGVLASLATRVTRGDYDIDDHSPRIGVYGNIIAMVEALKTNIDMAKQESDRAREESVRSQQAMASAEAASKVAQSKTDTMIKAAVRLEEVAQIVSSASTELSAQIEQSERGSAEQAARVAETATAMEEMNSTVLEVAKNAGAAADVSLTTRQKAEAGAEVVRKSVASIQQVQKQSLKLKADMTRLDENAKAISQIMGVISDIADQTNLLALNAAIEAARAGDAGRGFAVVADEVRKLAEKTMASTTDVGNAIRSIQQSATESMTQVDASGSTIEEATIFATQSGEALSEIVTMVDSTADQVRAIATAAEEQSSTSDEINRAINHVNSIATETARAMSEAAKAVSDLAGQSHVLTNLIEEMKRG